MYNLTHTHRPVSLSPAPSVYSQDAGASKVGFAPNAELPRRHLRRGQQHAQLTWCKELRRCWSKKNKPLTWNHSHNETFEKKTPTPGWWWLYNLYMFMICFKTMNIGIFMICCFVCLWNTSQQLRTSRVPCTFFKLCSFVWDLVNMTQTPSVMIMIINDIYIYFITKKENDWWWRV